VSPTATPTATPLPYDCVCVPKQVVPQGNLVSLKNVSTGEKGSTLTRTVTVKLIAEDAFPGSCQNGSTSGPTAVGLYIEDDDEDVVIDEVSKTSFICTAGKTTHVKFWVRYEGPENCEGSAVPTKQTSNGDLDITATTSPGGELNDTLRIQCKR